MINEPAAYNGYTLFAPNFSNNTYLINNEGLLVHQWVSDYHPTQTAYLMEDGNLIRSALITDGGTNGGGYQELAWDSTVVREFGYVTQHHDIEPLPNGNVLMIINDRIQRAAAIEAGRDPALLDRVVRLLKIVEVEQSDTGAGTIVWEWRLWDHLIQEFDSSKANFGVVADHPELVDFNFNASTSADWIHTNSIDYHPSFDQILVGNREQNDIWIIDHSTTTEEAASDTGGNSGKGGDLLYRWGNPASYQAGGVDDQQLFGPHDASWIEPGLDGAGHILVFNNGFGRPEGAYSSIEEIAAPVDSLGNYSLPVDSAFGPSEPSWSYQAGNPTDFYSARFSGAQRLPNGNTLICEGVGGTFFEITPAHDVVWKYVNPVTEAGPLAQGDSAVQNEVARCYRYGPDYPGLVGKDLTPGLPIEIYLANADGDQRVLLTGYSLKQNYPNPFNPLTTIGYAIPGRSRVDLVIFNLLGQEVRTLLDGQLAGPGAGSVMWDGKDNQGRPVTAGIYVYSMRAGRFLQTRKLLILK
jgi:hypothetical protein